MAGCCYPHDYSASRIFSWMAGFSRWCYTTKGLGKSQRQILEGLVSLGFADATILDIGCGVGYLHQILLEAGASSAFGIDLSEKMLAEARNLARDRGLERRTEYRQGDFVALAGHIQPADITLLDKVVCCYPDAHALVQHSLAKTKRLYALTYPRNLWWVHLAVRLENAVLRLFRSAFRTYVHDPGLIESLIANAGFQKRYEAVTGPWLTQVYVRTTPID